MQMDGGNIINKSIMTDSQIHYILLPVLLIVLFYIIRAIKQNYEQKRELERIRLEYEHRCNLIRSVTPLDRGTKSERDLVFRLLNNGFLLTIYFMIYSLLKVMVNSRKLILLCQQKQAFLFLRLRIIVGGYLAMVDTNNGHK